MQVTIDISEETYRRVEHRADLRKQSAAQLLAEMTEAAMADTKGTSRQASGSASPIPVISRNGESWTLPNANYNETIGMTDDEFEIWSQSLARR